MGRLKNGTVVPHYMGVRSSADRAPGGYFDEVSLRVGEVTDIVYSNDARNVTGDTEYIVDVWRRQGNGAQERLSFHCMQADGFGSIADFLRFSLRSSTVTQDGQALSNGATVLVACLNGDRSQAYIIGAIPQPNRDSVDPTTGRYLRSRFNGVEMAINDDGSFSLTVPGATDTDGKPDGRDGDNHGSKVTFAANGDITIDDQNGDTVKVSPGSKTIAIEAGSNLTEHAGDVEVNGDSSWKLTAPKVVVVSPNVNIGQEVLPPDLGVVHGEGIDTFTGLPYFALGNASATVKVSR